MSHVDARALSPSQTIEADVCVVGAGAAGLALAQALPTRLDVVVLESGGFRYEAETQDLYAGKNEGADYPIETSRLRYFGGTTNHWGGNVRPLDPIDFTQRPWIPDSGWPIGRNDLDAHYQQARAFLGLPPDVFDARTWEAPGLPPLPLGTASVENNVFPSVVPSGRRLGPVHRQSILSAANVRLVTHANLLEIQASEDATHVTGLRVGTLGGVRFTTRARAYVLAAGGIENARLLLLSDQVHPSGLGNQRDLVGRYFADHHVVWPAGLLLLSDPSRSLGFYDERSRGGEALGRGVLTVSEEAQRDHHLNNMRFQIGPRVPLDQAILRQRAARSARAGYRALRDGELPDDLEWHVANVIGDFDELVTGAYLLGRHRGDYPSWHVYLIGIGEPRPHRDSRVRLGSELDALGQRRVVVDWQWHHEDLDSFRRAVGLVSEDMAASGIGRVRDAIPDDFDPSPFRASPHSHHMGTTRMHDDPARGVVDRNGRVHGIDNLYVAGSSVFPTFGNANPTLTILALTFRLAEHLQGGLS